jgi:hypothetical protein
MSGSSRSQVLSVITPVTLVMLPRNTGRRLKPDSQTRRTASIHLARISLKPMTSASGVITSPTVVSAKRKMRRIRCLLVGGAVRGGFREIDQDAQFVLADEAALPPKWRRRRGGQRRGRHG